MNKFIILCLAMLCFAASAAAADKKADYWVEPMKKVHEGFKGNKGYVAQLGDSITYSMAFWAGLQWGDPSAHIPDDGLPKQPASNKWGKTIKGFRDKGGGNGNYSGWRIGNLLKVVDGIIAKKKPEVALIMIGTNDVRGNKVPDGYEKGLDTVITKLIAANCVPIISTIPPMRGKKEGVDGANVIIKKLAEKHKIPLIDYHAEIMKRAGDNWDGTLISKDGVHPSGPAKGGFTEENLKKSGYSLRNYLSLLAYRQVYFKALGEK